MTDLVMGLIIGFAVGSVLLSVLLLVAVRRARQQSADRLSAQTETIADLRLELAEDKETNRRLRHQLHSSPGLPIKNVSDGTGADAGVFDTKKEDLALEEPAQHTAKPTREAGQDVAELRLALENTRARLEDREAKLREYREAVNELRLSLEGQDKLRDLNSVTEDVPVNAQSGE